MPGGGGNNDTVHEIHIPMRWADIDQLNHVNNVVYIDYAMEARAQMVDDGLLDAGLPIRRVRVDFTRPMLLSSKPAVVRSAIEGEVVTQEVRSRDGSAIFSTIVTEYGQPEQPAEDRRGTPFELRVRRGDLGPDGAVTVPHLFELIQEARIQALASVLPLRVAGRFVVGRVELELGEPLLWRSDAYPVQSHISHVGRSSFSSMTRIDGGRFGSATSTHVGFDPATQASRRLDDDEREALTAALLPA
jgi:acyl-CoA thioester hydrolase